MALISKKEAGEILGRSERAISDWVANGVLRVHQVKQTQWIDSDTVYALKDTEADITHALEERQKYLDGLNAELKELRKKEHWNYEPVRCAVKDLADGLDVLREREKKVVCDVLDGYGFETIGDELYLTRERVRQVFYKALRRLGMAMKSYRKMLGETMELRGQAERMQAEMREKDKELQRLRKMLNIQEQEPDEAQKDLLNTRLVDMNLSVRALNCLKAADIETLGQLTKVRREQLLIFRNFGKRTLTELDGLLDSFGLEWGKCVLKPIKGEGGWIRGYEMVDEQ